MKGVEKMVKSKITFSDVMWLVQHPRGSAARELWARIKPLQEDYNQVLRERNNYKRRLTKLQKEYDDYVYTKCVCR
jgi:molecular chaperone GrpE (heat shock protein)